MSICVNLYPIRVFRHRLILIYADITFSWYAEKYIASPHPKGSFYSIFCEKNRFIGETN